jgi:hypothetical protein
LTADNLSGRRASWSGDEGYESAEEAPVEHLDVEVRGAKQVRCAAVEVAADEMVVERIGQVGRKPQERIGRADMLQGEQLATRSQHSADLGK